MKKQVITRFPPSPTGLLQMGNVRTAIYNYLLAKQNDGVFLFRIEDTDRERSTKEYETELVSNLTWLRLLGEPVEFTRQSERGDIYQRYLEKLVKEDKVYVSKENTGGDEMKRAEVIRFRNPNKEITFTDLIRGEIKFDTTDLKDFIIAKSMSEPLYHLAVVVDDFESGITHIVRGEDHISNTPRQILIQEAIGAPRPLYAHLPLILDKDRTKLSKRKHGENISLKHFIDEGFLPSAILNYLSMLGWNPGGDQEIFTLDELVQKFDISKVQKGGAIFNEEKLRWVNKEHLRRIPNFQLSIINELKKNIKNADEETVKKLVPIVAERIETLGDVGKMVGAGELVYFFETPLYEAIKLSWKGDTKEKTKEYLENIVSMLEETSEKNFTSDEIKNVLWPYAEKIGKGSVLWPLRFCLSGRDKSPDPFALASVLGKEETIKRIKIAIQKLQ